MSAGAATGSAPAAEVASPVGTGSASVQPPLPEMMGTVASEVFKEQRAAAKMHAWLAFQRLIRRRLRANKGKLAQKGPEVHKQQQPQQNHDVKQKAATQAKEEQAVGDMRISQDRQKRSNQR